MLGCETEVPTHSVSGPICPKLTAFHASQFSTCCSSLSLIIIVITATIIVLVAVLTFEFWTCEGWLRVWCWLLVWCWKLFVIRNGTLIFWCFSILVFWYFGILVFWYFGIWVFLNFKKFGEGNDERLKVAGGAVSWQNLMASKYSSGEDDNHDHGRKQGHLKRYKCENSC